MLDPSFLKLKIEKISNQALGVAKDTEGKKYFIAKTAPNDEIEGEEAIKVFKDVATGKQMTGLQENLKINMKIAKIPPPNDADIEK